MPDTSQIPSTCIPAGCSGWLAVTDEGNRRVQVVTLTGQVIRVLTNQFEWLSNCLCGIIVCVNSQGDPELLVADSRNHRVVAFRLDGSAARVVCDSGKRDQVLGLPAGLALTVSGDLWVVEHFNNCVSLFR
jgi:hypothetical protein